MKKIDKQFRHWVKLVKGDNSKHAHYGVGWIDGAREVLAAVHEELGSLRLVIWKCAQAAIQEERSGVQSRSRAGAARELFASLRRMGLDVARAEVDDVVDFGRAAPMTSADYPAEPMPTSRIVEVFSLAGKGFRRAAVRKRPRENRWEVVTGSLNYGRRRSSKCRGYQWTKLVGVVESLAEARTLIPEEATDCTPEHTAMRRAAALR